MKSQLHWDIDAEKPFIKCVFSSYMRKIVTNTALRTYKGLRCLNVKGVKWDQIAWNVTLILENLYFIIIFFVSIFPGVIFIFFFFSATLYLIFVKWLVKKSDRNHMSYSTVQLYRRRTLTERKAIVIEMWD